MAIHKKGESMDGVSETFEYLIDAGLYALKRHEASWTFSGSYFSGDGCLDQLLDLFDIARVP
jgi:hypothetical protein